MPTSTVDYYIETMVSPIAGEYAYLLEPGKRK